MLIALTKSSYKSSSCFNQDKSGSDISSISLFRQFSMYSIKCIAMHIIFIRCKYINKFPIQVNFTKEKFTLCGNYPNNIGV